MKIHAYPLSPASRLVVSVARFLNIPFTYVGVDLMKKEHLRDEYVTMNPNKRVPLLEDDQFKLAESMAITRYLCDSAIDGNSIYPTDP